MTNRPIETFIVAFLFLINSLLWLGLSVVILLAVSSDPLDFILLLVPMTYGIVGLIVFIGLWRLKKWGWLLALIITLGGLVNSIRTLGNVLYLGSLILSLAILILLIMPTTRRACSN